MSSSEHSEDQILANGIQSLNTVSRLKSIGIFMLGLSAIMFVPSVLYLVSTNRELVQKNHQALHIIEGLEDRNEKLDSELQCRANRTDLMNEAVGRGLAAVARDDSAELELQAQAMLDILQRPPCEQE